MNKKILIDLTKCRNCKDCTIECEYNFHPSNNGMKNVREVAAFTFTCRQCEEAPCISVCPKEALERDPQGIIGRAYNLCVGCKSCIAVCPFGTLMNDIIEFKKSTCDFCDLSGDTVRLRCIETCPEKAISLVDGDMKEEHVYELNDRVLVKEFTWENINQENRE